MALRYPHGQTPLLEQTRAALAFYNTPANPEHSSPASTIHAASQPEGHAAEDKVEHVNDYDHYDYTSDYSTEEDMALKVAGRPPPLRMDSTSSTKSLKVDDPRKPQTPSGNVKSFFGWKKNASPGAESTSTEISDSGRSPQPSPYGASPQTSAYSTKSGHANAGSIQIVTTPPIADRDSFGADLHQPIKVDDLLSRVTQLENELKEITAELAGSIKREMDLEDEVDRLQLGQSSGVAADRTSDYFSDSGTSSVRPPGSDAGQMKDDIEKIKRESEQHRAQLKVDLSQKWQEERAQRKALESHIQILEDQISQSRQHNNNSSDMTARAKELENSLDDARRRLAEERQIKENFEDLLTALRVDLEQHRSQRDNLRDEVVPQLQAQIDGLEASLSETQKQPYDYARMQQEIKALKDENAALISMRDMNSIAEDGDMFSPTRSSFNLSKSSGNLNRSLSTRNGLGRSGSLSRSKSIRVQPGQPDVPDVSFVDQIKAVEVQRDALHTTVKYLLRRQEHEKRQLAKRLKLLESERDQALSVGPPKKSGYEKEVRSLRQEINSLRKRADDAMEQKWQCENGLGGLKMDLDRSKQETSSLRQLLQEKDSAVPEALSVSLEQAYSQLQQDRKQAKESLSSLEEEERLANQLQESAARSEALAAQVKSQLQTNSTLRSRLRDAVDHGERNQRALEAQINDLQAKLGKLEDTIQSAQTQSETAVMKHEEEVRLLRASTNVQLLRSKNGLKTPTLFTPTANSPLSPMFTNAKRSPRLDMTSTGPGMALHQALKTEYLEKKVSELEKALAETEQEMGEVVGRMNTAQMGVAELQSER